MDDKSLVVSLCLISAVASHSETAPRPGNYMSLLGVDWRLKTFQDKDGFFLTEETAVTDDNYVLTMHHLGSNKCSPNRSVLFLHGLLGASDLWLMQGPGKDLAFILAEACYDVWLANFRGNFYSRVNTEISPKDPLFWDFSFDEMGRLDTPAMIDKIREKTGRDRVSLVAHSMGCAVALSFASAKPNYARRVDAAVLLAPAVLVSSVSDNNHSAFRFLDKYLILIPKTGQAFGCREFYPRRGPIPLFVKTSCDPGILQSICLNFYGFIFGENRKNLNLRSLGDSMVTVISGASAKSFIHLNQLSKSNWTFRKFNFGRKKNLEIYGSCSPPEYPLEEVNIPVFLYSGRNDVLVTVLAVEKLSKKLPNVVSYHIVEDPLYTHMDFIWGLNAKEILYNRILEQMASVNDMVAPELDIR